MTTKFRYLLLQAAVFGHEPPFMQTMHSAENFESADAARAAGNAERAAKNLDCAVILVEDRSAEMTSV